MGLIAAKCTQCGAILQVDDGQDAAICVHCGTPFIVEKAINNYNTSVVNNISAEQVVVSTDGFSVALDKLRFFNQMERWVDAEDEAEKLMEKYPSHPETWYESAIAISENFTEHPARLDFEEYLSTLEKLVGSDNEMYKTVLLYYDRDKLFRTEKIYNTGKQHVLKSKTSKYGFDELFKAANCFKQIPHYNDADELYHKYYDEACELVRQYKLKNIIEKIMIGLGIVAFIVFIAMLGSC